MGASGYSIAAVNDVPLGGSIDNIFKNLPGVKLRSMSLVQIFLTRESVDVLVGVTIGGSQVLPSGSAVSINTVDGSLPSTQDDEVLSVIAQGGDEIIVSGTNSNVAAQQLRGLAFITPIDDAMLRTAIKLRKGTL